MQTVHRLDEKDIISILAKHFKVLEKEVSISCVPETVGYGESERTEYRIQSKIVINK